MKEVSSKKIDVLISFAYAMIISLGVESYCSQLLMDWLSGIDEYPYVTLYHKCLAIAAFMMLIVLIVLDCIRGRKFKGALLMRILIVIVTFVPGVLLWAFFSSDIVRPIVHFVRTLF